MNVNKTSLIALVVMSITFACSSNKDHQADTTVSDSSLVATIDTIHASAESVVSAKPEQTFLAGEYLVGDGNLNIVPVGETVEIRDGMGKATDVFFFQGVEDDTLSVYSNKNKSTTFKMNPDHKTGKYYTSDEKLPVEYVGPIEQ